MERHRLVPPPIHRRFYALGTPVGDGVLSGGRRRSLSRRSFNDIVNENRAENNSLDQLEALRDTVNSIFNQQSVNLFRLETINVQTQPVALIAFNHYGDTDLEEELVSLNMTFNPSFVAGDFNILTR